MKACAAFFKVIIGISLILIDMEGKNKEIKISWRKLKFNSKPTN